MSYALSTQGQGDAYLTFSNWSFNATASNVGTAKINLEFSIEDFRGSAFAVLLGASSSTITYVRVNSDGSLEYRVSGTRIISPAGAIQLGQRYLIRLDYVKATTTTTMYINNAQVPGEYVASNSNSFNQINRVFTGTANRVSMTVYSLFMDGDANYDTYSDFWNDTTAPSAGANWMSTAGSRNLSIVGATGVTNSWWINYGGVSEHTATINSVYPQYSGTVTTTNDKPVFTVDINSTYPAYAASVNATLVSNNRSLSINSVYPTYTANVTVSNTKPVFNVVVNSTYAQYSASVNVNNTKPVYDSSVNTTYPKYAATVNVTIQPSGYSCSINATYPVYTAGIITSNTKPVKTVNINVTYPVYTASVTNTNTKPIYTVNVTASYSKYTASVVATVAGINSLSINTSYPKYTANVVCDRVNLEKTISINATYPKYVGVVVLGDFVNLPRIGGKGAHINILSGSRKIKVKDKSRNVKWRVENARL